MQTTWPRSRTPHSNGAFGSNARRGRPRSMEVEPLEDTKPMLLRTSPELHARLERSVQGNRSMALLALIEEALERLESGHECWRVIARDIK